MLPAHHTSGQLHAPTDLPQGTHPKYPVSLTGVCRLCSFVDGARQLDAVDGASFWFVTVQHDAHLVTTPWDTTYWDIWDSYSGATPCWLTNINISEKLVASACSSKKTSCGLKMKGACSSETSGYYYQSFTKRLTYPLTYLLTYLLHGAESIFRS